MCPDRDTPRAGDTPLGFDPAARQDAALTFIGQIRSTWAPGNCPRNLAQARASGQSAWLELRAEYAPGLDGLAPGQPLIVLYWMDHSRRDLIAQKPRNDNAPRGTFALRSPVRPNPVALACVRITSLDIAKGVIGIDAIDCFDATPLIDIKPWREGLDSPAR